MALRLRRLALALLPLLLPTSTDAPRSLYGDDRGATAAARAAASAAAQAIARDAATMKGGGAVASGGGVALDCPDLITRTTDAGQRYASLVLEPAVATRDGHASSWHVQPHAWSRQVSGGAFPLGTTDVSYVVSDADTTAEATVICTTTVEVIDREAPDMHCPDHLGGAKLSLVLLAELASNVSVVDNSGEQLQATCGTSPNNQKQVLCTARDSAHNMGTCTINVLPTQLEAWAASVLAAEPGQINLTLAVITLASVLLCASLLHRTPSETPDAQQQLMEGVPELPGTPFSLSRSPGSVSGTPPGGSSPSEPMRSIEAMWEKWAPQHTPLRLPPQLTPATTDAMRSSANRSRLETEVRWLAEQLASANARGEENAAYMQKILDSERQQLQSARAELIGVKESCEDKLNVLQEKLISKEQEFHTRDEARAEQLEAAMDAHNTDRDRLMSTAAQAREAMESVLLAHEADKTRIFELKSSLSKLQDSHEDLTAKAQESSLRASTAEVTVCQLNSTVEEQKQAFFAEAKEMETAHNAAAKLLRQKVDEAEDSLRQATMTKTEQQKHAADFQTQVQVLTEQAEATRQELLQSHSEISDLRATETTLRKQLGAATADAMSDKAGASATEEQAAELQISLYAAEARVEEITAELEAREVALQDAKAQIAALECNAEIMSANIGTLEVKLSTSLRHREEAETAWEAELTTLQLQLDAVQSSLISATEDAARARDGEQKAKELWCQGEQQLHAQLEMLEAMNSDVAQMRNEKAASDKAAADGEAAAAAARAEVEGLLSTKASIVSTIATQTSPLTARESKSHVLSEKLATLQKQAEQMREDTIHLLGREPPTPGQQANAAAAPPSVTVLPRVVPDKLHIVTPGSGKQAPSKKARIHRASPTPARVISAPMESPSPPRLVENQAEEELAAQALKFESGQQQPTFFDRNPGIHDAVSSPALSARRHAATSKPKSPATPSEASEALRKLRAREHNRGSAGPPPVPPAALSSRSKSPSAVPIPATPSDGLLPKDSSRLSTSSRWAPPPQASVEVVWPAEKRVTASANGKSTLSLSDELTWLHSPGV